MSVRTTTRLLAAVLAASVLLCACNNGESASQSGNLSSGSTVSNISQENGESSNDIAEVPDYMNELGTLPICKETTSYKLGVIQSPYIEDYETNTLTKMMEERGNMEFEFELIPSADASQKLQLAMASFELADAYFGVSSAPAIFNVTNIVKFGKDAEGQLIPLEDYIESYSTYYKQAIEKYEADGFRQSVTSSDGHIYFMPHYAPSRINRSPNNLYLNQNFLKALDKKAPSTTDELYDLMVAIRDGDPNGNGKKDEIPATGTSKSTAYDITYYILGSFMSVNTANTWLLDDNGTVTFGAISDGFREGVKFLHKLGAEGLISPLTFTQDVTGFKQIATDPNDVLGMFGSLGLGIVVAGSGTEDRWTWGLPVEGPDGTCKSVFSPPLPSAGGIITSVCEKPEAMFVLMDWLLSEEGTVISRYGLENEHWKEPEEGFLNPYGEQATLVIMENIWAIPQNVGWQGNLPAINDRHNNGMGYDPVQYDKEVTSQAAKAYLEYEPDDLVPISIYTLEESEIVNEIKINLGDFVKEAIAKFTIGEWDPNDDAAWEKYVKEIESIGLSDFLKCSQAAYDRANS